MSNTWSSYDALTGVFDGASFVGQYSAIDGAMKIKPNAAFIMGEYDRLSERVDVATGLVVDYIPPRPTVSHQWDAVKKRWVYVANAAEALYDAQHAALAKVNAYCALNLSWIRTSYPTDEVASWDKQENEARTWTVNPNTPTPLLSAIATARGVPFGVLVSKIIAKADQFAAASGKLIGERQQAEDRINAAKTADEVKIVMLSYGNIG